MRDLRYAIRVLLKAPAFTITAVLTLALCIGANTAIFTVVDRVLLRPLPYPHPDRLAMVVREKRGAGVNEDETGQAGQTWAALKQGADARLDLAALVGLGQGVNFIAGGRAQYIKQQRVSAGYFRVLGTPPALGREFTDDDDRPGGPAVAILSHSLWTDAFSADRAIVGRAVTLRGEPYTVVGVMAASFPMTTPIDVWTPLRPSLRGEGSGENYTIIARLKDGVGWAEADALVASSTDAVVRDRYRQDENHIRIGIVPLQRGQAEDIREPLVILWSAVGVVLVIGCVNIAGLLLARSAVRRSEIATRMAIGGSQAAIVRQLLVESALLAAAGGAVGIAIGFAATRAFASILMDAFGVTGHYGLDARVFAITAAVSLVTSVVFGLFPALQSLRVNLREELIESSNSVAGPAHRWPRRLMVLAEVALGVVLLVGAGLLIRTFDRLLAQRPGFDATHVMTATLSLQDTRYRSAEKVSALFDRTLERMREAPGVERAAASLTLPYERALNVGSRWVGDAKPGAETIATMNQTYVTPGYFEALRIPVVRGRVFTPADAVNAEPVIVVNEAFVRRSSPDVDPIGRRMGSSRLSRTIIGVVGDIQQKAGWGNFGPVAAMPATYIPVAQVDDAFMAMVHTWFSPSWFVRTAGPQQGVVLAMQNAVQSVDPLLPFAKFRTLDDVRDEAVVKQRAQATLLGTLAGLAVLLAAVGLYGLVANSVEERRRELGIRLALGASSRQAIASAAAPGLVLSAAGVAIGLAAARLSATTLRHLVFGVSVTDPATFAIAAGTVFVVAAVATLVPALRMNPLTALRR
jgi:putative ABC transport system permease protein